MNLLITGFPGFLGTEILKGIVKKKNVKKIYLLVEKRFIKKAEKKLPEKHNVSFFLIEGDISKDGLGINLSEVEDVSHVVHLAALFDLSAGIEQVMKCNVKGTENILNFSKKMKKLKQLIYFSTAYVSGKRKGVVREHQLVHGYGFRNNYEYSKYLAELIVRENMKSLPITIIRPAIVVGNSKTGETEKFDGLYFFLRFIRKYPQYLPLPYLGKGSLKLNIVPVDFIVEAFLRILNNEKTIGKTYHFVDPFPLSLRELQRIFVLLIRGKEPKGSIPLNFARFLFKTLGRKITGVVKEGVDYFLYNVLYTADNLKKDLGLLPPSPHIYAENIVRFLNANFNKRELIKWN